MRRCCTDGRSIPLGVIAGAAALLLLVSPPLAAQPLDLDRALQSSQAAVGTTVGEHTLTDAEGRRVRLSDYRGRPLVVNFVYTGCTQVCPTTTRFLRQAFAEAQGALGPGAFNAATIGFNLPFDNPQAMRAFARKHGAELPQWAFLSPDAGDVDSLTREFGFVYARSAGGFDHLTQLTILDANGRIARQIYGESFTLPMLVGPLKGLASGTRPPAQDLSTLVDRVRVLCTVYDPLTGRYRLDYGLFIEIFAGLSILGGIVYYLSHEWRRQRRPA
jgi:protein SCO1